MPLLNPHLRETHRLVPGILAVLFAAALVTGCTNRDYNAGVKLALDRHFTEAFSHFTRSALDGYTPAMLQVGNYLEHGIGVKADKLAAEDWYLRAYQSGDEEAIRILGKFYLEQKRYPEALEYLGKGLHTRDGETVFLLARCYEQGWGTQKNLPTAIKYFTLAANLNYPAADSKLHQLGVDTWDTPGNLDLPVYSLYLIEHPRLWFALLFLNLLLLPIYIKSFFSNWEDFATHLQCFQRLTAEQRLELAATGWLSDIGFARLKTIVWLVFYLSIVTAQYKLIALFVY